MSTKKLLKGLKQIRDEIAGNASGERVQASIASLRGIAKIYKAQLEYEKTKGAYPEFQVKLFEPFTAVSEKDRENLDSAIASIRQLGKRLREIKMSKMRS